MSLPSQKRPKSRARRHRSQYIRDKRKQLLGRINIVECFACGEKKLAHTVCKECAAYKPVKEEKKIEKKEEKAVKEEKKKKQFNNQSLMFL